MTPWRAAPRHKKYGAELGGGGAAPGCGSWCERPEPGTAAAPGAAPGTVGQRWLPNPGSKAQTPGAQGGGISNPPLPNAGAACGGTAAPRERAAEGRAVRAAAFADLVLETWDLQCERNGREHRTAEMGTQQLVVRRGQPFTITLRFSGRGYEEGVDKLAFNVETGQCRRAPREPLPAAIPIARGAPVPSRQGLVLCAAPVPREKVEPRLHDES